MNEKFFFTNDFSKKVFAHLSKNTNTVKKEDLLDEIKRLIIEHILHLRPLRTS